MAAAGRHFLSSAPFGGNHIPGIRIAGWEREDVVVETVEIRTPDGAPRSAGDIDAEVRAKAKSALAKGRGVIAHLLDVSKTGLTALTRAAAEEIHNLAPDRVLVLADCCQMRSPASRLRGLLESGFMIAATGSKFYSGPPFSGALLVPDSLVARLGRLHLPEGLAGAFGALRLAGGASKQDRRTFRKSYEHRTWPPMGGGALRNGSVPGCA